jgi:hypothetical protein
MVKDCLFTVNLKSEEGSNHRQMKISGKHLRKPERERKRKRGGQWASSKVRAAGLKTREENWNPQAWSRWASMSLSCSWPRL